MASYGNSHVTAMISIVCQDNYIDVLVKLGRAIQTKYRFFIDHRHGSVKVYTNGVRSSSERNPKLDVQGAVCLFIFKMICQKTVGRLVIDTSKLTTQVRKSGHALDRQWSLFFAKMKNTLSHLPAPVAVSRFEVNGHQLLNGIEVDAFWNYLVPGTLKVFVHKGRSTPSSRGSLNYLTTTEQWKKAEQISTEFYGGIKFEDICDLENVTVRMENFLISDFQDFINKITCSDLFSSCQIKIRPTGALTSNWMSGLKKQIVWEMEHSLSVSAGSRERYFYKMQNGQGSIAVQCVEEPSHLSITFDRQQI